MRLVLVGVLLLAAAPAAAQPASGSGGGMEEIDDAVARHLLARGKTLYAKGDHANAKMLFVESLERSPDGPYAQDSLAMLRAANERLGYDDLEHGRPTGEPVDSGDGGPLDPYGTDTGTGEPLDPYGGDGGNGGATGEPLDPYGGTGGGEIPDDQPEETDDGSTARRRVAVWSGGYGALLGLAIGGPENDEGETSGGAVLAALLGAGAGAVGGYYALSKKTLTVGQGQAIISGGTWGVYSIALFGDAVTGVDSTTTNEGFKAAALGGAVGLGGGIAYAVKAEPSADDVGLINSCGLYGTTAGLMLGAVMQPTEGEGYSINMGLGALAGLGAGAYLTTRSDVSRGRMLRVDLGVLGGVAATWALFYPIAADDTTNNDEQAAGAIALVAGSAGGYLAWRLTDGMDDEDDSPLGDAPVALVTRSSDGGWQLGTPLPRPMENPVLAPRTGAFNLGLDVVSGRF